MIAVFYGRDDFSAHEALDELIARLDTDGMLADNTTRLEAAEAKPADLLAHCQTIPFLGAHRLVVVRGLLSRFETQGRGRRRRAQEPALGPWEPFIEGLRELPESTVLVFLDGEVRAQNPMLQALRRVATDVREFKPLSQGEVAGWITRRAPRYGATLEARATAALAQLAGTNLWTLDNELRKLAVHAGDRAVTADDVHTLVSLAREPSVFAMADAVVEGRVRDAAGLVQRLLADGEPPQRLLAMIARQYRLLLLTKELLEQRTRAPEISARLGVQGFVVQRLLAQAPNYTSDSLRRAYTRILGADLAVKRGIHDDETALDLLIFDLATVAGASPRGGRPGYSRPPAGRGPTPPAPARA